MPTSTKPAPTKVNGLDTAALTDVVNTVKADPSKGIARFSATTTWKGGPRSDTHISSWSLGDQTFDKDFTISIDEPEQLLGSNTHANPQEYLLAAMNSCLLATFVAACAVNNIPLTSLQIESEGTLDLRGFLALDSSIPPGYKSINYTIKVKGPASREQFEQIHAFMRNTSPNFYNMAERVTLNPTLVVM